MLNCCSIGCSIGYTIGCSIVVLLVVRLVVPLVMLFAVLLDVLLVYGLHWVFYWLEEVRIPLGDVWPLRFERRMCVHMVSEPQPMCRFVKWKTLAGIYTHM